LTAPPVMYVWRDAEVEPPDPTWVSLPCTTTRSTPSSVRQICCTARAENPGVLAGAFESARHAAAMAELDRSSHLSVVSSDEVISYARLLGAVPDEVRRMFASRVLGRLLEYDEAHHAGLLETLRTFLAQSGSWTRTAAELILHVNTVRYRIARVEELTGRDLSRLEDRVDLLPALHSL